MPEQEPDLTSELQRDETPEERRQRLQRPIAVCVIGDVLDDLGRWSETVREIGTVRHDHADAVDSVVGYDKAIEDKVIQMTRERGYRPVESTRPHTIQGRNTWIVRVERWVDASS